MPESNDEKARRLELEEKEAKAEKAKHEATKAKYDAEKAGKESKSHTSNEVQGWFKTAGIAVTALVTIGGFVVATWFAPKD